MHKTIILKAFTPIPIPIYDSDSEPYTAAHLPSPKQRTEPLAAAFSSSFSVGNRRAERRPVNFAPAAESNTDPGDGNEADLETGGGDNRSNFLLELKKMWRRERDLERFLSGFLRESEK